MTRPPVGLRAPLPGVDDGLAGSLDGGVGLLVEGLAGDGGGVVELAASFQAAREEA